MSDKKETDYYQIKGVIKQARELENQKKEAYAIEFANWLFNIDKEVLSKQLKEFKEEYDTKL